MKVDKEYDHLAYFLFYTHLSMEFQKALKEEIGLMNKRSGSFCGKVVLIVI
ncbi:hypothetical protein [Aminipila sp.]|uniref:hypothetical protein n=1 Tax=Aminipila sp. TaxID=2060095 RepID=UPI00289DA0F2|nr:hypothetical protein [Aminipila sp.]